MDISRRRFFSLSALLPAAALAPSSPRAADVLEPAPQLPDVTFFEAHPDKAYVLFVNRYSQTDRDALNHALLDLGVRAKVVLTDQPHDAITSMEFDRAKEPEA